MADRTQKALSEFVSEAQETIDALGRDVMRLESAGDDPDPDLVNAVFRAAHTLKGLSSMFAVERMARVAHAVEDVLDDVRMGRRALDRGVADLLLEAPEAQPLIWRPAFETTRIGRRLLKRSDRPAGS